jgi:hypothetical protein
VVHFGCWSKSSCPNMPPATLSWRPASCSPWVRIGCGLTTSTLRAVRKNRAYCPLTVLFKRLPPLPAHLAMRMFSWLAGHRADPRGCCGSPSVPAYDSGRDVLASRVLFTRPALFFGKPDRVSISALPNDGFRPARRFDITLRQRPRLTTSEPHAPTRHRGGSGFRGSTGEFQNVRLSGHRLNILQRLGKLCLTKWL